MNDEFLHRLRKDPRPQFAARLQARLRLQAMSPPPPRVPSRTRTLLTLLLLGGAAFAITAVLMRGLPPPLVVLYHHATAWITAERSVPGRRTNTSGTLGWSRWRESWAGPPNDTARNELNHPPATAPSAQGAEKSSAASPAPTASAGGAPAAPGVIQTRVVASWSAYAYVAAMAESVNSARNAPAGAHIDVSLRDSDSWPGPLCGDGSRAPDLAYAFGVGSSVVEIPCPAGTSNNSTPVKAVPLGYEGVILARSPLSRELDLTRRQVFLALAKWVPDPSGAATVAENTNMSWRQIDASLGSDLIEFMGPTLSSPAGHSMIELLMEAGCDTYPWIAALESTHPAQYARICRTVRTDGVYTEVASLTPSNVLAEPNAVGIFGFGHLNDPAFGELLTSELDGVPPSAQALVSGAYPGVRTFYLYTRGRVPVIVLARLLNSEEYPVYADWALVPVPPKDFQATLRAALGP
jgi:phosphate transport system substrate-binding protein